MRIFTLVLILLASVVTTPLAAQQLLTDGDSPIEKRIKVFPNPVQRYIQVSVSDYTYSTLEMRIKDITGKLLQTHRLEHSMAQGRPFQVDLFELPDGVYLIDLYNPEDHQMVSRRVLKR